MPARRRIAGESLKRRRERALSVRHADGGAAGVVEVRPGPAATRPRRSLRNSARIAGFLSAGTIEDEPTGRRNAVRRTGEAAPNGRTPRSTCRPSHVGVPYALPARRRCRRRLAPAHREPHHIVVHPAPWYIGVRRPPYFVEQKAGISTDIVTVGLDGSPSPACPWSVKLTQIQWKSVRRSDWRRLLRRGDTERKEVAGGNWTITTAARAVPLQARCRMAATSCSRRRAGAPTGSSPSRG